MDKRLKQVLEKCVSGFFNPIYIKCGFVVAFAIAIIRPLTSVSFIILVLLCLWSAAYLIKDLLSKRTFLRERLCIVLIFLILSYSMTSLVFHKYGSAIGHLKELVSLIIFFLLLFPVDKDTSLENASDDIYKLNQTIIMVACIPMILSSLMYLASFSLELKSFFSYYPLDMYYGKYQPGVMMSITRRISMFTNPNATAALAVSTIHAIAINCAIKKRAPGWFYVLTGVSSAIVITITYSRSNLIAMAIFIFIFGFLYCTKKFFIKSGSGLKSMANAILLSISGVLVAICIFNASVNCLPIIRRIVLETEIIAQRIEKIAIGQSVSDQSVSDQSVSDQSVSDQSVNGTSILPSANTDELNRIANKPSLINGDMSNGRLTLWKSQLKLLLHSPWIGVSRASQASFARTVYSEVTPAESDTHNMYIAVLLYTGIIGFSIFLIFFVSAVVTMTKGIFAVVTDANENPYDNLIFMICAYVCAVAVQVMFSNGIIFSDLPFTALFWPFLGYVMYFSRRVSAIKLTAGK